MHKTVKFMRNVDWMCDSKVFQAILHRQSDLNISDMHFTYVNYFHVLISSECFVERLKSSIC